MLEIIWIILNVKFLNVFIKYNRFLFFKIIAFISWYVTTENPRSGIEKITKDIRNLFRLKKIKEIKDIVLRNRKNLFEYEKQEETYYKPVRVNNVWSNNYTEYKCNGDKNKVLSVEEYLNKIRPYLKGISNNLKKSDMWKIQLAIMIFFLRKIIMMKSV